MVRAKKMSKEDRLAQVLGLTRAADLRKEKTTNLVLGGRDALRKQHVHGLKEVLYSTYEKGGKCFACNRWSRVRVKAVRSGCTCIACSWDTCLLCWSVGTQHTVTFTPGNRAGTILSDRRLTCACGAVPQRMMFVLESVGDVMEVSSISCKECFVKALRAERMNDVQDA